MNEYIYPSYLKNGDKAIILSPSGCIESAYIDGAISVLEEWGLDVHIAPHARCEYGRYGGTVSERLHDLQNAMDDKDAKLILCSRGGYGIVHLLNDLDFTAIRKYPKWLVGFSDITALHLALLQNNVVSLHAPMARHLVEDSTDVASNLLRDTLFVKRPEYNLYSNKLNRCGEARGYLFGGNLAVLSALVGTPYMNLPENGVLFIEDVAERPYKIDRMIWHLKLSGVLSRLSGLIVGQFSDYDEDPQMGATVYESILQMVEEYDFPVAFDFPVGHVKENYALLHGAKVFFKVEVDNIKLEF